MRFALDLGISQELASHHQLETLHTHMKHFIFRTCFLVLLCVPWNLQAAQIQRHGPDLSGPDRASSDRASPDLSGPYLANATRNSWADQNSIVLWTRTTRLKEFVATGKPFIALTSKEADQLSHGEDAAEMLGAQLPSKATLNQMIGACPGQAGQVRLSYYPHDHETQLKSTPWKTTIAEHDFTAQWRLEGLQPDTLYATVVEARPDSDHEITASIQGRFRTAPTVEQTKQITFCVTTCHDFIRRDDGMKGHKIYLPMTQLNPDFVVHAGDIEYYDKPEPWAMTKELMRFKWGRIFALPNNRQFYNVTSTYFLKDDHDTLKNDCWPGQRYGSVSFEEGVQLFNEEQFPSHSPRYKTVQWGRDLQIWFLEGRDYRSPNHMPDGPNKTVLGQTQKQWLFETLAQSKAKFKIICSPTPLVGPDRSGKNDNHTNHFFQHEGDQLRSKLAEIENVIVLCGDRHWQYASVDEETKLWEFGCGPGSDKHQFGWKAGDQRPVHRFLRVEGGFLSGELRYSGPSRHPKLTIRHHKTSGESVSEFGFPTTPSENLGHTPQ